MKVVVAQFMQETNSFSPLKTQLTDFKSNFYLEGESAFQVESAYMAPAKAMAKLLSQAGIEVIPSVFAFAGSSGPLCRTTAEQILNQILLPIQSTGDIAGVFLVLHGAMSIEDEPDAEGYILEKIRGAAGKDAVIAASCDFHANITSRMMQNANVLCGYKTYPHTDLVETAQRAARLGIDLLCERRAVVSVHIKLPMILQAETTMTTEEPMKSVIEFAGALEQEHVYDISVFLMQPWLDTQDAGASVVAVARNVKSAREAAWQVARKLWAIKAETLFEPMPLEEALLFCGKKYKTPCILADSADSPGAGSPGDSPYIAAQILEKEIPLKGCTMLVDAAGVQQAFSAGVGQEQMFTIGGSLDPAHATPLRVKAEVLQLHTEPITAHGAFGESEVLYVGNSAVLRADNILFVLLSKSVTCPYPELYLAHGVPLAEMDFIVVKSATQYRAYYGAYTDRMITVDTPGVSSARLSSFCFRRVERPIYPFDDFPDFQIKIEETSYCKEE